MSTYEEACRCPKCSKPGNPRVKRPAGRSLPGGTMVHLVYCENDLCPWYDTCWMVQVNADGSVPPPTDHTGAPKIYERFEGHDQVAEQIRQSIRRQQRIETEGGGGEVRER